MDIDATGLATQRAPAAIAAAAAVQRESGATGTDPTTGQKRTRDSTALGAHRVNASTQLGHTIYHLSMCKAPLHELDNAPPADANLRWSQANYRWVPDDASSTSGDACKRYWWRDGQPVGWEFPHDADANDIDWHSESGSVEESGAQDALETAAEAKSPPYSWYQRLLWECMDCHNVWDNETPCDCGSNNARPLTLTPPNDDVPHTVEEEAIVKNCCYVCGATLPFGYQHCGGSCGPRAFLSKYIR